MNAKVRKPVLRREMVRILQESHQRLVVAGIGQAIGYGPIAPVRVQPTGGNCVITGGMTCSCPGGWGQAAGLG